MDTGDISIATITATACPTSLHSTISKIAAGSAAYIITTTRLLDTDILQI